VTAASVGLGPSTYDVAGPVDAPAIVFAHGTRLTRAAWAPQMEMLSDTYRVVALDLPGHGVLADRDFTVASAADELGRVVAEAAGGRAVIVGLSLGGYVAMDLAAREPGRVRGLVLSGATQEPIGLPATPYMALAWALERFDGPGLDALNAWFFRTRFPPAIAEPIVTGGFYSTGGAAALRDIIGQRFAPRLAAYDGPVLIVNGDLDPLFRLGAGRFARAARHARRIRLAGASHLANLDRPEAFNEALRRFMGSLESRS
jgi:pimeloyl-ACP methyl ester carboxylesterase